MNLDKKKEALEFGLFAEEQAAREYIKRGYTVLERRWKLGKTEIDLIVRKDDTIVIAEVKARNKLEEDALSAVTIDKRRRMIRAADAFLRKVEGNCNYRFDIVTCVGNFDSFELNIYEDAFLAADLF